MTVLVTICLHSKKRNGLMDTYGGKHLKLRAKTTLTILILTLCIGMSSYLLVQEITLSNARTADENEAQKTIERTLTIMKLEISHLDNIVDDWASWTDTYNFVQNNNTDYIETNMEDSTFTSIDLNLMLFFNSSNQFVYGKIYDLQRKVQVPIASELLEYLSIENISLNQSTNGASGILLLEKNPMFVSLHSILTSERKGPSHGILIIGRVLDAERISTFAKIAKAQLSISPININQSMWELQTSTTIDSEKHVIHVETLNSTLLSAITSIIDIKGNPAVLIGAEVNRDLFISAQSNLLYLFFSILLISLISGATTVVLMSKLVLARLSKLDRSIRNIEESGLMSERVPTKGNDELSSLTSGFNQMLDRLAEKEDVLRRSQIRFEGLFVGSPVAACFLDLDFAILEVNPIFTNLFGYSDEETKGKKIYQLITPPNRIQEVENIMKQIREGYVHVDTERKRKDGSIVAVSISGIPLILEEKLAGYIVTFIDISEIRKAEKKITLMLDKLRFLGSLTRHDIRNKLAVFDGYVYLLRKRIGNNEAAITPLNDIQKSSAQILQILEFARLYEQIGVEELSYVDVETLGNEAFALFTNLEGITAINECQGLFVFADSLLRQIFYNLIHNTLKYGEKTTRIRMYFEEDPEKELKLIYEDNGVGITSDIKTNLFREGYGKGTGYGLYLIKKICGVYGWKIEELGLPGQGVKFVMFIPQINENGKPNYQLKNLSRPNAKSEFSVSA